MGLLRLLLRDARNTSIRKITLGAKDWMLSLQCVLLNKLSYYVPYMIIASDELFLNSVNAKSKRQ